MSQGSVNSLCIPGTGHKSQAPGVLLLPSPLQRFQALRTQGKCLETAKSVPWKWRTVVLGAEKAQRKHHKYSCAEWASACQGAEGLESPTP